MSKNERTRKDMFKRKANLSQRIVDIKGDKPNVEKPSVPTYVHKIEEVVQPKIEEVVQPKIEEVSGGTKDMDYEEINVSNEDVESENLNEIKSESN